MANLNVVALSGRISKEPEVKRSNSGMAIMNLSIACSDMKKNTSFFNIVVFGKTAEFVERYLGKGWLINVKGHLNVNSYTNNAGQKIHQTQVIAETVEGLSAPKNSGGNGNNYQANNSDYNNVPAGNHDGGLDDIPTLEINSDDLPF